MTDAFRQLDAGDVDGARHLLQQAMSMPPDPEEPLVTSLAFADALRRAGYVDEVTELLRALISSPNQSDFDRDASRCWLADHLLATGRPHEVETVLDPIEDCSAVYPHRCALVAVAYAAMGRDDASTMARAAVRAAYEDQLPLVLRTLGPLAEMTDDRHS